MGCVGSDWRVSAAATACLLNAKEASGLMRRSLMRRTKKEFRRFLFRKETGAKKINSGCKVLAKKHYML